MSATLPAPTRPRRHLTPREREVVAALVDGLSNDQIARRLGLSRWTVVNYLRSVMRKWNCTSRVDVAVRWTVQHATEVRPPD